MPLSDMLPLFQRTAADIRASMDTAANAGLSSDDPRWVDTREGTFYWDATQPGVLEFARLWDALSFEYVAAVFPEFAWGVYLDYHGATFGLVRLPATPATGVVTFTGAAGTVVASGTQVSATPTDPSAQPLEYETTSSGVMSAAIATPSGVGATPTTGGGTLPAATYAYRVTAIGLYGETLPSTEVTTTLTGNGHVTLDWPDVAGATSYVIYRGVAGGPWFFLASSTTSDYTDTGAVALGVGTAPTVDASAGVRIGVEALDAGSQGNVSYGAIRTLDSPNPGITGVINESPFTSGTDEESDEALRTRILTEYQGQGGGNTNDYRRWGLDYPGVARVSVNPVWRGPGSVQVVAMLANGQPVSSDVVVGLQTQLDPPEFVSALAADITLPAGTVHLTDASLFPTSGEVNIAGQLVAYTGKSGNDLTGCTGGTGTFIAGTIVGNGYDQANGKAPAGANVTVQTSIPVGMVVAATIVFKTGYSLDGGNDTVALRDQIVGAITDYINSLDVGEALIYDHLKATLFQVVGVYTVSGVTVNGGTSDIAITSDPPEVAVLSGTPALS